MDIKDLKYVICTEWGNDGVTGTFYRDAYGTSYEELLSPITEIICNFGLLDFDEDEEAWNSLRERLEPTAEYIRSFRFESSPACCKCALLAEGLAIAPAAAAFYQEELYDPYDEDDEEIQQIIQDALDAPDDYDTVIALLDMLHDKMEEQFDI